MTTACAASPGVVFEKLHWETTLCTWHFKNIARLPKRGILSRTHCFSHYFILQIRLVKAVFENDLQRPRKLEVQFADRYPELKRKVWSLP
ncbi:MAG: hypothetical protein EHM49_01665 [Deltaproteobacteria bacterium]|nr:MAG: hypothetical protein EHM49_01665 [Deltaproteobacteria bacterium]